MTTSPERIAKFSGKEDKLMKEIIEKYSTIMNGGQLSLENLHLKKIRYHHPIFKQLSYNAFKMVFDLCEIV